MALVTCPDCKNEVADNAESCPNCGGVSIKKLREKEAFKNRLFWGSIMIIILLICTYFFWPAGGLLPKNELPKGPGSSQNRR